jgi:hypothetical protein
MSPAHHRYRLSAPVLALFLACLGAPAAGQAQTAAVQAPPPRWPLDLPARWLTSNFMEYRGGRFHAGVDFKTRETEGFPAFAVESGWISRVRATPGGYGRAVYLRGDSGRTYVYAHLGRFSDRIGALVGAAQAKDGRYRVELELDADELPVVRGEVLGLTGQSGTTGPHLHFEVRDEAGRPVDPLAAGFAVRDTIAPVIHHVRAIPASITATLEGGTAARKLPVAGQAWSGGLAPALRVTGPIAFSARVVDGTDPAGHRLEPWLIELRIDGDTVYRRANESFAFEANAQQRLEWLECGELREQWLHRHAAVAVPGREGGEWFRGAAGQGLAPGSHRLELVAIDRAGNRSSVAWDVVVTAPGTTPASPPAAGEWETDPVAIILDDPAGCRVVLTPLFGIPPANPDACGVLRLDPGTPGGIMAPVILARELRFLTAPEKTQAAGQGLTTTGMVAGMAVRWEAASWPVEGAPQVELPQSHLPLPPATPVSAVYRWDGAAWTPAGPLLAPTVAGGPALFALARPGLHAVLRDTLPPDIAPGPLAAARHPGFGAAIAGVTPPRWTILPVGVRDAGAGVDAGSITARWDGRPLVVEPDLLRDRILVEIPDSTRAGAHALELEVADGAGLRAVRRLEVNCR